MSKTNNRHLVTGIVKNILSKNLAYFFCSINSRNSSTAFFRLLAVIIYLAAVVTYITCLRVQFENVKTVIVCFFCKTGAVALISGLICHRSGVIHNKHNIRS